MLIVPPCVPLVRLTFVWKNCLSLFSKSSIYGERGVGLVGRGDLPINLLTKASV